jgi:hypothetical protein
MTTKISTTQLRHLIGAVLWGIAAELIWSLA